MTYYKKLIGERIYLSPKTVSEDEIQKHTEWMNDFEVTDYLSSSRMLYSPVLEKEWLETTSKDKNDIVFNIIDLETDKLIGSLGLHKINHIDRCAEMGIFIGDKDYRSHGYGAEAINLIVDFGFNYLNLHSVYLYVLSDNERAHKCYLKCGFKDVGCFRDSKFINGKYHDLICMDILESEFKGDYIKNKVSK